MEQPSGQARHAQSTRRWPRQQVDLPVRIIALNDVRTTPVPARGSAISRAGMALRALVALNPGDSMLLQFPTSVPSQVKAVVRSRTGESLGLEFLTQLPRTVRQWFDQDSSLVQLLVVRRNCENRRAIHATRRLSMRGYVESRKN